MAILIPALYKAVYYLDLVHCPDEAVAGDGCHMPPYFMEEFAAVLQQWLKRVQHDPAKTLLCSDSTTCCTGLTDTWVKMWNDDRTWYNWCQVWDEKFVPQEERMFTRLMDNTQYICHGFWGKAFSRSSFRKHVEWQLEEALALALFSSSYSLLTKLI